MDNRRNFLKKTTLLSAGIMSSSLSSAKEVFNILGANDRLRVALIGVRSRGKGLMMSIKDCKNVKISYCVDVDEKILKEHNIWCEKNIGYVPKNERDFREVLEDKSIDAVFIATPEHWHTPMAIMSLQAGKHVYVEKPCSHNLYENDLLVLAQKKYNKKVQMGNQQRSAKTSQLAIKEIRQGIIGTVYKAEAYYSNNRKSIGRGNKVPIPKTLDWELWQGPAPRRDYRDNIHPYNWHWFRDWGTGEIHNNGTHEIDICRWALGVDIPNTVTSFGGKYTYDDDWEFPDNQQVTYAYDDKFITWLGHSRGIMQPKRPGRGVTIYGSKGAITLSRNSYELYDLAGRRIKQEKENSKSMTMNTVGAGNLTTYHIQNFFDAIVKSDALHSDIKDASITTMLCHFGNIAQDLQKPLTIDKDTGKIKDKEAKKYYKREYEPSWEAKIKV